MIEELKQTSRKLLEEAFFSGSVTTLDSLIKSIEAVKHSGKVNAEFVLDILQDIRVDHQTKLEKVKS